MESTQCREPWNKGKLVGQKPPLKPKDIWAIRINLQNGGRVRDLAMFNLAIDSKLAQPFLILSRGVAPVLLFASLSVRGFALGHKPYWSRVTARQY